MSRISQAGLAAAIAAVLSCASLAATGGVARARDHLQHTQGPAAVAQTARGAAPAATFTPTARAAAIEAAEQRSSLVADRFGLGRAEALHVSDVMRDADGATHVRYTRELSGLPVIGGDFVVHQSPAGDIEGADFAHPQPLSPQLVGQAEVPGKRAAHLAVAATDATAAPSGAQKVVWAVDDVPRLAWLVEVTTTDVAGNPAPQAVVLDAGTGAEIQRWDLHQTAKGEGRTLYSGRVPLTTTWTAGGFALRDKLRGGAEVRDARNKADHGQAFVDGALFRGEDNRWGNGRVADRETVAADAAYGAATTWDFFQETFHRSGIRGDGQGAMSRVHYGKHYGNAFWSNSCFCMTYGDGGGALKPLVSLDVAGHEMTHGVTSSTAGLLYFGDMGGLNEATSDIFGTMVEFFADNPKDPGDYLLGEETIKAGHRPYLRRMDDPSRDGASYSCWTPTMGLDNVHYSSGPANHFFYLLSEGYGRSEINGVRYNSPTCNGKHVRAIGQYAAGQIWYRALTRYFVSTTGYREARDATIQAALDLYGIGTRECYEVGRAWDAVGVPMQRLWCGDNPAAGENALGERGGFERQRGLWNAAGSASITKRAHTTGLGQPHAGAWYASAGFAGHASRGSLATEVAIPDTLTARLSFYLAIGASTHRHGGTSMVDGAGSVVVSFNGARVARFDQTEANDTYQRWTFPMADFAGDTGILRVMVRERAGSRPKSFFGALVDDVAVTG